jgi:hypothetical protein
MLSFFFVAYQVTVEGLWFVDQMTLGRTTMFQEATSVLKSCNEAHKRCEEALEQHEALTVSTREQSASANPFLQAEEISDKMHQQ